MSKYHTLEEIRTDIKKVRLEKNIIKEKMQIHVYSVQNTVKQELSVLSFSYVAAKVVKRFIKGQKK